MLFCEQEHKDYCHSELVILEICSLFQSKSLYGVGMPSNFDFQIVEVIKEDNGGTYRLGCSIGGGIDQDEMMNPFNQGFF